jgi:Domain of unknown function (DUF222)
MPAAQGSDREPDASAPRGPAVPGSAACPAPASRIAQPPGTGSLSGTGSGDGVRWLPGSAEPAPRPGAWLSWQADLQDLIDALAGPDTATPGGDPDAPPPGQGQALPPGELAALAAGRMPPGPALAAVLDDVPATELGDAGLADAAAACRRIAAWAQARELGYVAHIASRSAAEDPAARVGPDGRPDRVTRDAQAQVSLALNLTSTGAEGWADLAVTLTWRLPAAGAALAAGQIDLARARLIADATMVLDDQTARKVADLVLPDAGQRTTGWLRAALRRAVIAADPEGAERRRQAAERRAKLVLYPDEETTATLAGQNLPGAHAAAAQARIKAMARALRASGAAGTIDLLSAQVFLGLLLGTLPPIPPPQGDPPDDPAGPADGAPPDDPSDEAGDSAPREPGEPNAPGADGSDQVPWPDAPSPGQDDPGDDPDDGPADPAGDDDDSRADDQPVPAWPELPARIPPGLAGPARGMLDLTLPWQVLAGVSDLPGSLTRLGPVTGQAARALAALAAAGPATWRVIVTGARGQAIAVAPIPRRGTPAAPGGSCIISRVSVVISEDQLGSRPPPVPPGAGPPGEVAVAALAAAERAAATAAAMAAADAAAGGCAHARASPGYRPPPSLWEYIADRDVTCRFPTCRNPAWRGDLDHTIAWEDGGLTCACNLGGLCRAHHLIKQHRGWTLRQDTPGILTWVTPAGKTYTVTPDPYPV